jgi:sulfate adenylyltransferase subunit 2
VKIQLCKSLTNYKIVANPPPKAPAGGFFVFKRRSMAHLSEVTFSESAEAAAPGAESRTLVTRRWNHLRALEAESIYILREAAAEFARPVMLYSIGKDSSVMLRLAQKAFFPGKIPFPLLHVDTSYKFPEMIAFRDTYTRQIGVELIVHKNQEALDAGANPFALGTQKCCGLLKTKSLLDALAEGAFDAAFGGARRDEEKSRAKERIYSFRDALGQWDPKNQRPELWNIFNSRVDKGESIRIFPLSNWTELDIWLYIHAENIPIVPLYFAKEREVVLRNGSIVLIHDVKELLPGEKPLLLKCRMRSLGCVPCTGAIRSEADSVAQIVDEMVSFRRSERENRAIDHDEEGSMELKKREGYF